MGALDGRCALITGAASGIGLATAKRLTAEGARVAVVDLNEEGAKQAAGEIGGIGIGCDVGQPGEVADAFARAERELGKVDISYLNAGVTTGESDLSKLTEEQYRRIMGVNVDGVVYGVRESIRAMERAGGGAIVATASLAGVIAYPPDPVYALTKHAVVGLMRAIGPTLKEQGITANAVCPGIVETPLVGTEAAKMLKDAGFPLLQPGDIAEGVFRAITEGRSGEAWVCQPGREPVVFGFRNVPGPRTPGAEGMRPPGLSGS